jgi:hypothetical protein
VKVSRLALALALAVAAVSACGDDGGHQDTDGSIDSPIDAPIDTPPEVTFTSFVIDLVQNQTASNTDPVPYASFSTLNDPDQDNPAAYAILFN